MVVRPDGRVAGARAPGPTAGSQAPVLRANLRRLPARVLARATKRGCGGGERHRVLASGTRRGCGTGNRHRVPARATKRPDHEGGRRPQAQAPPSDRALSCAEERVTESGGRNHPGRRPRRSPADRWRGLFRRAERPPTGRLGGTRSRRGPLAGEPAPPRPLARRYTLAWSAVPPRPRRPATGWPGVNQPRRRRRPRIPRACSLWANAQPIRSRMMKLIVPAPAAFR